MNVKNMLTYKGVMYAYILSYWPVLGVYICAINVKYHIYMYIYIYVYMVPNWSCGFNRLYIRFGKRVPLIVYGMISCAYCGYWVIVLWLCLQL